MYHQHRLHNNCRWWFSSFVHCHHRRHHLHGQDQETYVEENPLKYEDVDEETAKKRQRMQQFRLFCIIVWLLGWRLWLLWWFRTFFPLFVPCRVDMSHEDIARWIFIDIFLFSSKMFFIQCFHYSRMDRIYLSRELLAIESHTNTFYIGKNNLTQSFTFWTFLIPK